MRHFVPPPGVREIPIDRLDTRAEEDIHADLQAPKPINPGNFKNVWAYWDKGFARMPDYLKRNVVAWARRLVPLGWTIRVLDLVPDSPMHVKNFLDVTDPSIFPKAFIEGTLDGEYVLQHTSDLPRFPVLLRYGGVYIDVGVILFGDVDKFWREIIVNPASPYEFMGVTAGGGQSVIGNFLMMCLPNNDFLDRWNTIYKALWDENGGRTNTHGMCTSSLLQGYPLYGLPPNYEMDHSHGEDGNILVTDEDFTDYLIQCHMSSVVLSLVDPATGWDGPKYCRDRIFQMSMLTESNLPEALTNWNAERLAELLALPVAASKEDESEDQAKARDIVEQTVAKTFMLKLMHGIVAKLENGKTLGLIWRKAENMDNAPGTYAEILRHATVYWEQERTPTSWEDDPGFKIFRTGPLIG